MLGYKLAVSLHSHILHAFHIARVLDIKAVCKITFKFGSLEAKIAAALLQSKSSTTRYAS